MKDDHTSIITVENLSKSYHLSSKQSRLLGTEAARVKALDNLSFSLERGKDLLILGTKFSGKTTLLRILMGMIPFDEGVVEIAGLEPDTQGQQLRKKLSLIPTQPTFFDYLTVQEQLLYMARANAVSTAGLRSQISDLLQQWNLEGLAKTNIYRLSAAQRRYLSVAQSLVNDPEIILLDEPTLGLDISTAAPYFELVSYAKERGKTIIFASSHISKVALLGDEILILHQGKSVYQSSMQEFKAQGDPPQTFLSLVG